MGLKKNVSLGGPGSPRRKGEKASNWINQSTRFRSFLPPPNGGNQKNTFEFYGFYFFAQNLKACPAETGRSKSILLFYPAVWRGDLKFMERCFLYCYSFRDDKSLLPKGDGGIFAISLRHQPISFCIVFFLFPTINIANYTAIIFPINFFGKTLEKPEKTCG